jgi:peroxiredoxin
MRSHFSRFLFPVFFLALAPIFLVGALVSPACSLAADDPAIAFTDREKPLFAELSGVYKLPEGMRSDTTKELALQIRQLPATPNKLVLADALATVSTEVGSDHHSLQEVANTLAAAVREQPQSNKYGEPDHACMELASLVRYEHVEASLDAPQFATAKSKLEADDAERQHADFTLADSLGKEWNLKALRGKVVLVNFWNTFCGPCRKEMPDLEALYRRFKDQGFVVLAISGDDVAKVSRFLTGQSVTYPLLRDPNGKAFKRFRIEGIPKSFVYDRGGKLVAESIHVRSQQQFLEMLAQAGLQ